MNGFWIMFGLVVLAISVENGLCAIAKAIQANKP